MSNPSKAENRKTRRVFLRDLTLAAALPATPALSLTASSAAPPPVPAPAAAEQIPPASSPEARALGEIVRLRYGRYLEQGDMPVLERALERIARTPEQLLKVRIANGDAPDCLFLPDAP